MSDNLKIHGYTSMMSPESMNLPYLETLLSWAQVCDTITVCYSRFPKLDIPIPDGAVCPWEDDGSLEILERFNKDMLGGKLRIVEHEWSLTDPMSDGKTKQIARERALEECQQERPIDGEWLAHFDADEVLNHEDGPKLFSLLQEDNEHKPHERRPYLLTGILELFGGANKVRFNFGNWLKIRMTRPFKELAHGAPLFLGPGAPCRARSKSGSIIARDNRDDFAGFISTLDMSRPDYNNGLWAADPQLFNAIFGLRGIPKERLNGPEITQTAFRLQADLATGVWLYHTGWLDIARKWRMGWFWDNQWALLNGQQDSFIEKAEAAGVFTMTQAPEGEELEKKLEEEMDRPEIREIGDVSLPMAFEMVRQWRASVDLVRDIPGIPYGE